MAGGLLGRRHQHRLANTLAVVAVALNHAGHPDEAEAPARDAVTLYRELTAADPDRHQRLLADALAVLGAAEGEADARVQDAVARARGGRRGRQVRSSKIQ